MQMKIDTFGNPFAADADTGNQHEHTPAFEFANLSGFGLPFWGPPQWFGFILMGGWKFWVLTSLYRQTNEN